MKAPAGPRQGPRRFLAAALVWTPLELLPFVTLGEPVGRTEIAHVVASVLVMAVLTVCTWWAVGRWPVGGSRARPVNYAIHAGLMTAGTVLYVLAIRGWRCRTTGSDFGRVPPAAPESACGALASGCSWCTATRRSCGWRSARRAGFPPPSPCP